ncbi:uncharacterized protein [Palaemon carinicauda]|uniref:uncharacterized protein n=1 Tax=Palaemon carinicauda TaxID=392227 RepID=UPI0035B6A11B
MQLSCNLQCSRKVVPQDAALFCFCHQKVLTDLLALRDVQLAIMLYALFLSLLVTLASGSPRSRGEPLAINIQAESGLDQHHFYAPEGRSQGQTSPEHPNNFQPTPLEGAAGGDTFQVNLNTPLLNRVDRPLAPAVQQTAFTQSSASNVRQRLPPNLQSASQNQLVNQPNSISSVIPDIQFGRLPGRNNLPPVPGADTQFGGLPGRNNLPPVPGAVEMAKVKRLMGNPPGGALLVGSNPPLFPIEKRLISNYTKLRPVVTDTFRCDEGVVPNYVGYGYYADVDNDCQIFHICLPWKELYPKQFDQDITYQFSFICPNQTVFSQDVMTCTWKSEALPCDASPELYWLNQNFFRRVPGEFGMKYAAVNEKIVPPLVYDYDDFNPPKPVQG